MKITLKLILGLIIIISTIFAVEYYQSTLFLQVQIVSEYHDKMSIPAINTLNQIQSQFEFLAKSVHGFKLDHVHSSGNYIEAKEELLEKIRYYEELSYTVDSSQKYLADAKMQALMTDFVINLNEKFNEFDGVANKIFSTNEMDGVSELFELLDTKYFEFNNIVDDAHQMEIMGKNTQQKQVIEIQNSTNSLIVFSNLLIIIIIIAIVLVITKSISSQIDMLRKSTFQISSENYNSLIESKNDEFQPLRDDINKMASSIKKSTDERIQNEKIITLGNFASRLAHDMRNPLSIIQVSMENLKLLYGVNKSQQKQYEKIERAIFRMAHQIDDVLDFVKEKPLELTKIKTSKIILDALDSIIIPSTIEIDIPENDAEITCDEKQMLTALHNLILNAFQAVKNNGIIKIRIQEEIDKITIEIEDSGDRIPSEKLNHFFEPLFTTKQHGTGLGLVSVKNIIESHGGTVSVTSPPTIFTITLPKIFD